MLTTKSRVKMVGGISKERLCLTAYRLLTAHSSKGKEGTVRSTRVAGSKMTAERRGGNEFHANTLTRARVIVCNLIKVIGCNLIKVIGCNLILFKTGAAGPRRSCLDAQPATGPFKAFTCRSSTDIPSPLKPASRIGRRPAWTTPSVVRAQVVGPFPATLKPPPSHLSQLHATI